MLQLSHTYIISVICTLCQILLVVEQQQQQQQPAPPIADEAVLLTHHLSWLLQAMACTAETILAKAESGQQINTEGKL